MFSRNSQGYSREISQRFCGANHGAEPAFRDAARELGRALALRGIEIVYGGANCGLMGEVADAALGNGGRVIGYLPRFMKDREVAHTGLTEFHWVDSMHERKTHMFERSEGFIALPGGIGTLEEIIEVYTWRALKLHAHPIAFVNTNGFYDPIRSMFDRMETAQLLRSEVRASALFADDIESLMVKLAQTGP